MERGIFAYIIKYSLPQQIVVITISVVSFPFYYLSLQLPKLIVDEGIREEGGDFPREYFGISVDQIEFLLTLCFGFLTLVFVNGGFKYFINVYRGAVGERMLRRIRFQLIARVLRFPLSHFRKTSSGEIVSMIALETEPLGGFFGESLSVWVYQGGTFVTLLGFMFVQDWRLGFLAILLYPVQAWLIPKLQRKVNTLGVARVQNVRRLTERIGEVVTGAEEIHANDTSQYELADFSHRLGTIFAIRFDIYRKKFFIKFLNNFLAQLTPFFFYSAGGVLVIDGAITVGALVAILAAYKDVLAPWKILLTHYQRTEDARIKYNQLVEQFAPNSMLEEELQTEEPEVIPALEGTLAASNVSLAEDDGLKVVEGASLSIDLHKHIALLGPGGSGRTEFAQMIARLVQPTGGRISFGEHNIAELPETVTGRRLGYVGQEPYLFAGSVRDNLLYGLKHRPQTEVPYEGDELKTHEVALKESIGSGNVTYDLNARWLDYTAAGVEGEAELASKVVNLLRVVELEDDIYQIGLRQTLDPQAQPELADAFLEARASLRDRLQDPGIASNVELFDKEKYNTNASVAENILFGTPIGAEFEIENLGENDHVLQLLKDVDIFDEFLRKGHRLAEIMVDLFQGLPPDHEFFERFSFISSDDLPEFQTILRRVEQGSAEALPEEDRARLIALPFKMIPARHHLDLIDQEFQGKLLEARRKFHEDLAEDLASAVEFFEVDKYNAASSVQDNILFGKLASERAGSATKVGEILSDVVENLGLRQRIIDLGLNFDVGIGGSRLSTGQRQKLAISRSLMKQPDMLIMNEAMSNIDGDSQAILLKNIREIQKEKSLLVVPSSNLPSDHFDQVLTMEGGRITDHGTADAAPGAAALPPTEEDKAGGFGDEIDVLAAIPLFGGLDRSKLKLMAFASERFTYDADQVLFNQGDYGDTAYVVINGEVDVILETLEGPKVLVTMTRNDLFGELALLCDAPRTATIKARTDVTVLSISKDTFFKLIAKDLDMSARLTRAVAERLERTTRDLGEVTAIHDPVTNLPDARLFFDRLEYSAARSERFKENSTLLAFNLDQQLKAEAGLSGDDINMLLKEVADRISACMRDTDTAARLGPTEFAIIATPVSEEAGHMILAQRIAGALAKPIGIGGKEVDLGGTHEFRFHGIDDSNPEEQFRRCQEAAPVVLNAQEAG